MHKRDYGRATQTLPTVTQGGSIKHIVTNYWFMGVFGVKKKSRIWFLNGNQNLWKTELRHRWKIWLKKPTIAVSIECGLWYYIAFSFYIPLHPSSLHSTSTPELNTLFPPRLYFHAQLGISRITWSSNSNAVIFTPSHSYTVFSSLVTFCWYSLYIIEYSPSLSCFIPLNLPSSLYNLLSLSKCHRQPPHSIVCVLVKEGWCFLFLFGA